MNQSPSRQLSSRERVFAVLSIVAVVALLVLLYQPTGPRSHFRDLSEQNPLSLSFSRMLSERDAAPSIGLGESNLDTGNSKPDKLQSTFEQENPGKEPSNWDRQLALYDGGRFQEFIAVHAAQTLQTGGNEAPPRELLYLGSAQLLAGRLADATQSLRQVLLTPDSLVVAEARWQLAQAYLATEESEPARDELRWLIDQKGHRTQDARAQLSILESRLPAR